MKGSIALGIVLAGLVAGAQTSAADQLLRYNFDEASSGTTPALDGGAAPAANGTFSGSATRTNNTPGGGSAGAMDASLPNSFVTGGDADKLDGLGRLTLTAWINLRGVPANGNRIMSKQVASGNFDGFSFALSNPTEGAAERRADNFQLNMAIGGTGGFAFNTSDADLDADNKWIFVAVTYDGTLTADNLRFYSGGTLSAVSQLGASDSVGVGALVPNGLEFKVGAQSAGTASPPAWFDDVRVYNEVLDATQLNAVRLANVPEPGSAAVALGALGAGGLLARRRRRR